jgi:hypothetical protein
MPLYRVHAYDDEHWATLLVRAEHPEAAGELACQFVAAMDLGSYPADHEQRWPGIVRVEHARSWFDAEEPFEPVVETVEQVDEAVLDEE